MLLNPPMAWSATCLLGHVDQSPERLSALVRELPDASADDVADAPHLHVSHGQVDEIALDNPRRLESDPPPLRRHYPRPELEAA